LKRTDDNEAEVVSESGTFMAKFIALMTLKLKEAREKLMRFSRIALWDNLVNIISVLMNKHF